MPELPIAAATELADLMHPAVLLTEGDRVREAATGQLGLVTRIHFDNSCSDPGCCGGPFPDTAYVRMDCGHWLDLTSEDRGGWTGLTVLHRLPEGDPDGSSMEAIETAADLRTLLKPYRRRRLRLRPDATGMGIVLTHQALGPLAWLSWALIATNDAVRRVLRRVAEAPPAPVVVPAIAVLHHPSVGVAVLDARTGQPGTVTEIMTDPDPRWRSTVVARFACGHHETYLQALDGRVDGLLVALATDDATR